MVNIFVLLANTIKLASIINLVSYEQNSEEQRTLKYALSCVFVNDLKNERTLFFIFNIQRIYKFIFENSNSRKYKKLTMYMYPMY